ncbi:MULTISPECIES: TonB-dependent receptor domain-containing protein [Sphingomonas]|uniref:TonB-dependent receptor domain-containing protein n=1 Tax=Sphingomonas TaxID=13687 RepID=UPI0006F88C85|nr:TonB-dependent receptor [Sphingomonas sp. Leaf230]KQN02010.1 TonB-dependent receptor [Sphingomonas sp. Leaf230]
MRNHMFRDCLLASTMIAGAVIALPVYAQTTPAPAPQGTTSDDGAASTTPAISNTPSQDPAAAGTAGGGDIVVTGSRISNPNLTSASPITVVNAADIKLRGATRIEDVLNSLPSSFATQTSSVSNGSTGTATINLRNLGESRTLVLVNGRRLMPGNPSSSSTASAAADVNMIPASLLKRVDVLTGGAGSVYGSDAIGGVVNFVLDTDYEGFSIDTSGGIYNHNNRSERFQALSAASGNPAPSGQAFDGTQFDINFKVGAGTSDGRGHVVGYGGYRKIGAILQGSRDYSSCGLNTPGAGGNDYVCGGSPTAFPANFTLGDAREGGPPTGYTLNSAGQLVAGRTLYNANPLNYYQRPDKRYTAGFLANYEVSKAFKPYAEFMFMDDRSTAQIAPSGNFSNTTVLNSNNPFLSAAQRATFFRDTNLVRDANGNVINLTNPDGTQYQQASVQIGRRNVEGGGRQADLRHTQYRFVAGARGDIDKGISYEAYGQFGSTVFNQVYRNEFSVSRTTRALDAITDTRPGSATLGQAVCRSVVDGTDPNCVPLNIFGSAGITPAALGYVQTPGFQSGENKEKVVNASMTFKGGEYGVQSPFASEGIALNVGGEYRKESLVLEVDNAFLSGDLAGQGGATLPIRGSYDVKEVFGELQVPLVSDRPFFNELTVNGGYRYSSYSTAGSASSYKGEIVWAPISDIRFRGGYNRAVRAPNTQELFATQSVQIDGATDPCAGPRVNGLVNGNTAAQCALTGVAANQFGLVQPNESEQYNGLLGGNPNLKPEKADTFTAGVILRPSFLPGFNLSVDGFRIKLKDRIGVIGADTTIAQCLATGDQALCSLIKRGTNGTLFQGTSGYIIDTNVNAGSLLTQGIETSAGYTYRSDSIGTIGLSFNGTYVDKFTSDKAGAKFDCAGLYGAQCGYPMSKWRHQARISLTTPNGIGLSGNWRYLSATKFERTSSDADLAAPFFVNDARVKAQNYFDLAATVRVADKFTYRMGVNNILDKTPPILSATASPIGSFGNGNTYPGIYEAIGRYLFVGLTIDM